MRFGSSALLIALWAAPPIALGQAASWPTDPWAHQLATEHARLAQCSAAAPSITNHSLGPIQLGMPISEVRRACPNLIYAWRILEGQAEPVALAQFGRVTAEIEFADTLPSTGVYRIVTRSGAARTPDSVGPGTPASELARRLGPLELVVGEGPLYAIPRQHKGYSFELMVPGEWDWDLIMRVQRTNNPNLLPPGTRVSQVLIVGP